MRKPYSALNLGDGIAVVLILVWLSVGVGPWWLGWVIFFVSGVGNIVGSIISKRFKVVELAREGAEVETDEDVTVSQFRRYAGKGRSKKNAD